MWKVAVQQDPIHLGLSIYAVNLGAVHSEVLEGEFKIHVIPNEELHMKQVPMISIGHMREADQFMHALAEALAGQGYTKMIPADEGRELKAVKDHLNDMRMLVVVQTPGLELEKRV